MNQENIVIKGTIQKNKTALTLIIIGASLLLISFLVASCVFNDFVSYKSFVLGYGGEIYDDHFFSFFISEFFDFSRYYGYIFILGIIATIVGIAIKANTEKCEITVTDARVYGKIAHGKEIDIPINQVTAIHTCSFDGVSVAGIGSVNNFYCISNQDEVMKALAFLLSKRQQVPSSSDSTSPSLSSSSGEAEQLKSLKDLLDSDIISQAEFDAKKKQILNL